MTPEETLRTAERLPYQMRRLGIVMRPQPGDAIEAGGVLNPAGVRGPDGEYYLFPRLVAEGNYSRIGKAHVVFDEQGIPLGVERLGIALEPQQPYEKNALTGGGCEDPRTVFIPALNHFLMTYVAYGASGPKVALAVSTDLRDWRRLGLVDFAPFGGADMNAYGNKDALIFPEPVPGPDGTPSLALIHRPMYEVWSDGLPAIGQVVLPPPGIDDPRWTMWISYCPIAHTGWLEDGTAPRFGDHHLLMVPDRPWEAARIGGGTPPVRLPEGWLTIYHGIGTMTKPDGRPGLRYSAGALLLDAADPRRVLYRSPVPTLAPVLREERSGVVSDVVFPTAVDPHDSYVDVYYGMADACIGVARLDTQGR